LSHTDVIIRAVREARAKINAFPSGCVEIVYDERGCTLYFRPAGRQRWVVMPREVLTTDGGCGVS